MTTLEINKAQVHFRVLFKKKDSFYTISIICGFIVLSRNSFTAVTKEENSVYKFPVRTLYVYTYLHTHISKTKTVTKKKKKKKKVKEIDLVSKGKEKNDINQLKTKQKHNVENKIKQYASWGIKQ